MTFSEYCIFKWRNFAESLEKVWRKLWENDISLNFSLQIPSKYPKFFGLHDFWPDFLNFGSTVYKRRVWAPWTCMKHRFRTKKRNFWQFLVNMKKIMVKFKENPNWQHRILFQSMVQHSWIHTLPCDCPPVYYFPKTETTQTEIKHKFILLCLDDKQRHYETSSKEMENYWRKDLK